MGEPEIAPGWYYVVKGSFDNKDLIMHVYCTPDQVLRESYCTQDGLYCKYRLLHRKWLVWAEAENKSFIPIPEEKFNMLWTLWAEYLL